MSTILLPKRLGSSFVGPHGIPLSEASIDWESPHASNLVGAYLGRSDQNLVTGKRVTMSGIDQTMSQRGAWSYFFNSATSSIDTEEIHFSGGQPRTVLMGVYWPFGGPEVNSGLYSTGDTATGTRWELRNSSGALRLEIAGSGYTSSLTPTASAYNTLGCTFGSSHTLFLNGSHEATSGIGTVNTGTANTALLGDSILGNTDRQFDQGYILWTLVWDRELSRQEVKLIERAPWLLFKPLGLVGYFPPSAAGAPTNVLANTDALILTEQAATVNAETNVNAGADALVLTEQAASISLDVDVSATTDALVISTQAADVDLDKNVSATTQALVLTEQAASVSLSSGILANTASLTITEQAADVDLDKNVSATTDTLVITANAAVVTSGSDTNVLANTASLSLTEATATVNAETNVNANVDTLTMTGQTAQIGLNVTVSAGVDNLVIVEQAANITLPVNITPVSDTLVLTELAANITATEAADITVDGAASTIITTNYQSKTLYYNGTNYFTID